MSSAEESKSREVSLEHVIKKSDTGLVFYRKCTVDGQSYNVNNTVLLRDEGRYKLGYLLKIYCRTKGNERALVRWYFTDPDFGPNITEQQYAHEIFATSYTGKVAVSSIRKLVHVIWAANRDEIPESVPKDVYYVYRYFDHDKQALVLHRQQLLQIRYMPKPSPDSVGSSLSVKEKADLDLATINFSLPYTQNGATFYKVCTIGKDKYKIGDCVLLGDRDGSSIRRIISFSYNHENRPIAMGQFIYYQNEVTLSPEERIVMHFQEVLVSNWKRELLISNIKRKLIVIHQNIFQPVPENALKAVYFLKRYYDPFKKKIYPLAEPLTRSDFSIVPAPMEECPVTATLSEPVKSSPDASFYRKCSLGEEEFSPGDFVTLQSGSVCVRVLRLYYDNAAPVMDVNKLFTIRNVPSTDRHLLSTSLLFSSEIYFKVPCNLFFERICVVFNSADIANDSTFVAGDFFNAETKELFKLWKPAKLIDTEEVPKPGMLLRKAIKPQESGRGNSEESQSSSTSEDEDYQPNHNPPSKKKKKKKLNKSKSEKQEKDTLPKAEKKETKKEERPMPKKSEKEEKVVKEAKQENKGKKKVSHSKTDDWYSEFQDKTVELGGSADQLEFSWLVVGNVKAAVGDCVFVKITEGIQMGRIMSIYKDLKKADDPVRLKLFRVYLEEEMFVSKRESASIHINEAFATDFVIHALACQVDELVDVVYLKKKEKIPPQNEIPQGRLYVRRYYHPRRHLLRALVEPLDSKDLSILPQPHPPINGLSDENKDLNRKPVLPDGWRGSVRYTGDQGSEEGATNLQPGVSKSDQNQSSVGEMETESARNPVAVLEPKSVLSQPSYSIDIPLPGGSESGKEAPDGPSKECQIVAESEAANNSAASFNKISIVSESDMMAETMTILPNNMISFTVSNDDDQTVQVVQQGADQQTIQIVPHIAAETPAVVISSTQPESVPPPEPQSVAVVPPNQNTIEIVPQSMECSGSNQIQIMTGDSNQVQVITDSSTSSIQIVPNMDSSDPAVGPSFLPTIISSEQDMHADMDVDITHAADGCITIAPVTTKRNNTAKFEDSYTKDGRVYFRKCHFKDETIVQGESVYVRCNGQNLDEEDESWKLGRVMEFYHAKYPVVRLLWFYVEEEMVTSKNERASIHPQEVFASQCDDEVEISSIESKANVIYLKKGETIPKVTEQTNLFCRRFYDPYKHSIKPLKNRLSATDISILPEPLVASKRGRSSTTSTPQAAKTPDVKRMKTSPAKPSGAPQKQSSRLQSPKKQSPKKQTPKKQTPKKQPPKKESPKKQSPKEQWPKEQWPKEQSPTEQSLKEKQVTDSPRHMPFFSQVTDSVKVMPVQKPAEAPETSNKDDDSAGPKLFFATMEETSEVTRNMEAGSDETEKMEFDESIPAPIVPAQNDTSLPESDDCKLAEVKEDHEVVMNTSDPPEGTGEKEKCESVTEMCTAEVSSVSLPSTDSNRKEQDSESVPETCSETAEQPQNQSAEILESVPETCSETTEQPQNQSETTEKPQIQSADKLESLAVQNQTSLGHEEKSNTDVEPHETKVGDLVHEEHVEKENVASDSCVTL